MSSAQTSAPISSKNLQQNATAATKQPAVQAAGETAAKASDKVSAKAEEVSAGLAKTAAPVAKAATKAEPATAKAAPAATKAAPTATKAAQTTPSAEASGADSHAHKKLVKKKAKKGASVVKLAWLSGHSITLAFGTLYAAYYVVYQSHTLVPFLAYRTCLLGSVVSYVCTITSQFNKKSLPNQLALLPTANFQYMVLAVVWFCNRSSLFKILPYMIVSTLQLAVQFHIKPIVKLGDTLGRVAAYDELVIFLVLFVDTLLMRGTSGYALVIYSAFYWLRLIQSEDTRYLVWTVLSKLDGTMSKQKNPKVKQAWLNIKSLLAAKNEDIERSFLA